MSIDNNGFSILKIVIQPGQKIIWKNNGKKDRWPASNNHPTHTNYPTKEKGCLGSMLDACRNLETGESYAFVFDKVGSWGIHDHLNPGSIMVVEVANVSRGWVGKVHLFILNFLKKEATSKVPTPEALRVMNFDSQYSIINKLAMDNPKSAWDLLKSTFIVNGQVVNNPHELSHVVGNSAFRKFGIKGVDICDNSFAYGCYHGVAEGAITDKGVIVVPEIEKACSDSLQTAQVSSCYHGIGHGTAGIYSNELKPALSACDKMKPENSTYCYDGVFMEQSTDTGVNNITENNTWKLCGDLPAIYHIACSRYQPARLQLLGFSIDKIIASCAPAPSLALEEHCFRSSGFLAAGQYNQNVEKIIVTCNVAKKEAGKAWCLTSAATEMTFQAYNGWQESAPNICSAIGMTNLKLECQQSYLQIAKQEGR